MRRPTTTLGRLGSTAIVLAACGDQAEESNKAFREVVTNDPFLAEVGKRAKEKQTRRSEGSRKMWTDASFRFWLAKAINANLRGAGFRRTPCRRPVLLGVAEAARTEILTRSMRITKKEFFGDGAPLIETPRGNPSLPSATEQHHFIRLPPTRASCHTSARLPCAIERIPAGAGRGVRRHQARWRRTRFPGSVSRRRRSGRRSAVHPNRVGGRRRTRRRRVAVNLPPPT